jgi:hypothetical protein
MMMEMMMMKGEKEKNGLCDIVSSVTDAATMMSVVWWIRRAN